MGFETACSLIEAAGTGYVCQGARVIPTRWAEMRAEGADMEQVRNSADASGTAGLCFTSGVRTAAPMARQVAKNANRTREEEVGAILQT